MNSFLFRHSILKRNFMMEIGSEVEVSPSDCSEKVSNCVSNLVVSRNVPIAPETVTTNERHASAAAESVQKLPTTLSLPTSIIIQNPVTFNPLNRSLSVPERSDYLDPLMFEEILPVRCRNVRGKLHKSKFGSGNRGKCVNVENEWYTPSAFEALGGRAGSKDWKRSIRYGCHNLQYLIDRGVLRPHATSCSCGMCCDDGPGGATTPEVTSGPVRLFIPYKRKKRQIRPKLKVLTNVLSSLTNSIMSAPPELNPQSSMPALTFRARDSPNSASTTGTLNINEQKQWWKLEEMAKNAIQQMQELQKHIEILKDQSVSAKDSALLELRLKLDKEKHEALNVCKLEAEVTLSTALQRAKTEKEEAVAQAIEQARNEITEKLEHFVTDKEGSDKKCANCNRTALSECTGCNKTRYCSPFCQNKDWQNHKDECNSPKMDDDDESDDHS